MCPAIGGLFLADLDEGAGRQGGCGGQEVDPSRAIAVGLRSTLVTVLPRWPLLGVFQRVFPYRPFRVALLSFRNGDFIDESRQ